MNKATPNTAAFYGLKRIRTEADWSALVGSGKWAEGRSACALARAWLRAKGPPNAVLDAFAAIPELQRVRVTECFVEHPVLLDSDRAPSMNDIMVHASIDQDDKLAIAVEGKVHEPFDRPIGSWIRDLPAGAPSEALRTAPIKPTRQRRLAFLNEVVGVQCGDDIHYQLLHRTASAVLQARLIGASFAAVLIHSFAAPARSKDNWEAYRRFVGRLGIHEPQRGRAEEATGRRGAPRLVFAWVDSPIAAPG